jgi:hypothetical protein
LHILCYYHNDLLCLCGGPFSPSGANSPLFFQRQGQQKSRISARFGPNLAVNFLQKQRKQQNPVSNQFPGTLNEGDSALVFGGVQHFSFPKRAAYDTFAAEKI